VGVRSAVFDARRGFLLNGVQVKIQGTSNHVGFGGVGMAVPDRVAEFEVATLRAAGVNAWRTAHNPVAPELLEVEAIDEAGAGGALNLACRVMLVANAST
jgi:beta-galactosidase